MTKPVTIPNTFATATTAIPLSQLDSDFSTVATALNDANTYSNYAADTGVANAYVVTLTGVSTTYSAGLRIQFKAGNANTGASTLNVNGGGTKNITFQDASALSSGTIAANAIVDVMYDGTQFLLMNDPAGTVGTGDVVGPAGATANAVVRFDSTTGKLVKNSVVTIADSTGDMSGVGAFTASGNVTLGDATTDTITLTGTVQPGVVISGSSSGDALRITQTGAGNALLVEDAANPDSSPFVVDASGNVGIGTSSTGSTLDVVRSSTDTTAMNTPQIRAINSATATLNQRVDIVMRWADGTYNGTGGISMIRESATARSGTLAILPINSSGDAFAAARFDSSGNLGLGVTPSAWTTTFGLKAMQVYGSALANNGTSGYLTNNAYYAAASYTPTYIAASSTPAQAITFNRTGANDIQFLVAPSGTANTAVVAASTSYTVVALGTTTLAQWQASFSGLSAIPTLGQVLTSLASPVSPIPNGGLVSQNITFTQAMTLDASGNLGVGTSSPATTLHVKSAVNDSTNGLTLEYNAGTAYYQRLYSSGNDLYISADTGNTGGTMRFLTGGSERMRIGSGGEVYFPGVGTTASAANAYLNNGSTPANQLLRSTSSLRYKTDVETLDHAKADAVLNLRPVWYRSKAEADRKDWSWYGLIAEEVAQVEPRLVHWSYPEDQFETIETQTEIEKTREVEVTPAVLDDEGNVVEPAVTETETYTETETKSERKLKADAQLAPDGVQYDRLTVMLLDIVKRQNQRIEQLEAKVAALEAQ